MMCVDRKLIRERMFSSQISKMVKQKQCCQMQLKHRYICCKRSTFSIMSFSRISKLRSVESCPDVSQRCNDCSLRQSPISFAHKAFWCKIRSQKLANSACVNSSRQISAQSESNLTPDCLCSLVRFPQIFQSFTLTKLDRLSTVDLHTRLYRTSNKLSSG
jgi:hypothetical protein